MATKLNFIHFCDSAFRSAENGNLNLIGIFDTILSVNFPTIHPRFSVVVDIDTDDGLHTITLVLKKDAVEIVKIERTFTGPKHQWIHNFIVFKFPSEGEYEMQVYIDKNIIGANKLFLKKVS